MTIHLPSTLSPDILERILGYIRRQKVAFQIEPDTSDFDEIARTGRNKTWSDDPETSIIQSRLYDKYVVTGEWDKMDDEDRQDAVLGEKMVYHSEQPGYGNDALSESETNAFILALRNGTL